MENVGSLETRTPIYQATRCNIPERGNINKACTSAGFRRKNIFIKIFALIELLLMSTANNI
jgi:hypothetical protein